MTNKLAKVWAQFYAHLMSNEPYQHAKVVDKAEIADRMLKEFRTRFPDVQEYDDE